MNDKYLLIMGLIFLALFVMGLICTFILYFKFNISYIKKLIKRKKKEGMILGFSLLVMIFITGNNVVAYYDKDGNIALDKGGIINIDYVHSPFNIEGFSALGENEPRINEGNFIRDKDGNIAFKITRKNLGGKIYDLTENDMYEGSFYLKEGDKIVFSLEGCLLSMDGKNYFDELVFSDGNFKNIANFFYRLQDEAGKEEGEEGEIKIKNKFNIFLNENPVLELITDEVQYINSSMDPVSIRGRVLDDNATILAINYTDINGRFNKYEVDLLGKESGISFNRRTGEFTLFGIGVDREFGEGEYSFCTADFMGEQSNTLVSFVRSDFNPPEIEVPGFAMGEDVLLKSTEELEIEVYARDDNSGVMDISMYTRGKRIMPYKEGSLYRFRLNPSYVQGRTTSNQVLITGMDNAGNLVKYEFNILTDVTNPKIKAGISENYYQRNNVFYISRQDSGEGLVMDMDIADDNCIDIVQVFNNEILLNEYLINEKTFEVEQFIRDLESQNEIVIKAFDKAGNAEIHKLNVILDRMGPEVDLSKNNLNIKNKFNNILPVKLSGDRFFISGEGHIEVAVRGIRDDASGIKEVILVREKGDERLTEKMIKRGEEYYCKFYVGEREERIFLLMEDNLGHIGSTDYEMCKVISDSGIPEGSIDFDSDNSLLKGDSVFYKGPFYFNLKTSDTFALKSVDVMVNGESLLNWNYFDNEKESGFLNEKNFKVSLTDEILSADSNDLLVRISNFASREKLINYRLIKDSTGPHIGIIYASSMPLFEGETDYGYFNKPVKIEVNINDFAGDLNLEGAFLDCEFTMVDLSGKEKTLKPYHSGDKFFADVTESFRGYVKVVAKDLLGNVSSRNSGLFFYEKARYFSDNTSISLKPKKEEVFSSNTEVEFFVRSSFCGIRQLEYIIDYPGEDKKSITGVLTPEFNKEMFDRENGKANIFDVAKGFIPVSGNSNGITVSLKVTDNVGFHDSKKVSLSIDKTVPGVEISFEKSANEYGFYKEGIRSLISVNDKNFTGEGLKLFLSNSKKEIPIASGFVPSKDMDNVKEAHLDFDMEGDFTLYAQVTDKAGNSSLSPLSVFSIDKTAPVVSLKFDNTLESGNYNTKRRGYLQVVEENFDSELVTFINKGMPLNTLDWTREGDVNKCEIVFDKEGEYEFEVFCEDKAGNVSKLINSGHFIMDFTGPDITYEGVLDKSANAGVVSPGIIIRDANPDVSGMEIELKKDGEIIDFPYDVEINPGVIEIRYKNIESKEENDGLYFLSVKAHDLGGNESAGEISFSINRFGSVYALSKETQEISGKYLKAPVDICVIESNTDPLDEGRIRAVLVHDGSPVTLNLGEEYKVIKKSEDYGNRYEYIFDKELFTREGNYGLSLYSVDISGNINESLSKKGNARVTFGIDRTTPLCYGLNMEDGDVINEDLFNARMVVKDNLLLERVEVLVGDSPKKFDLKGDEISFNLDKNTGNEPIEVMAVDGAGNETREKFVVTFNKPTGEDIGIIYFLLAATVIAIIGLILLVFAFLKRRKNNDF